MRRILIIFFLLVQVVGYAQKLPEVPKHTITIENDRKVIRFELQEDGKVIHPDDQLFYTWFSHYKIHHTRGGFSGRLLHGKYTVQNKERDLIEQGTYAYGLKTKVWKTWYADGEIKSISKYKNGVLHGKAIEYDDMGDVISKVTYKNGKKHGKEYVYNEDGDVTITRYKSDKKRKEKKKWFFKSKDKESEESDPMNNG